MTDRELLELAAKAAGMTLGAWHENYEVFMYRDAAPGRGYWNPLTDDGDALRLAVRLGISVSYDRLDQGVEERRVVAVWSRGVEPEYLGNDPFAATRRAIVRAAVAIGGRK